MEDQENGDPFSEFETLWTQKINEKWAFDNLSEEEIAKKVDNVKRNCFILELQNEVVENYLLRHNPAAIRELKEFLVNQSKPIPTKARIESILNDKNCDYKFSTSETGTEDISEKEICGHLIGLVSQQIADVCMNSNARKRRHDKESSQLITEIESYNAQINYLSDILQKINEQFPSHAKTSVKNFDYKLLEMIKFMEEAIKKVNVETRKYSLSLHNVRKDYSKKCKDLLNDNTPVILADIKLLELDILKLEDEFSKDRQVFLDLKYLLDSYTIKLNRQKELSLTLKLKITDLREKIKKLDQRLLTIEKYSRFLSKEVELWKSKKIKMEGMCSSPGVVPLPKEYINQRARYSETIQKIKSMQRKVKYTTLSDKFIHLLSIDTEE